MRAWLIASVLFAGTGTCLAGDLNIHVVLSGEVAPGVYGQVQLGNEPRPPLVYAQPMLIEPQPVAAAPVYLHVPPGHAKNWRKHCHEYNACNRPVYFVRSAEYEPDYARRHQHDHDHDDARDHAHDYDHDHGHDHDGHDRD
jgi:hypothetical protein